jgi:hypothetical protein
MAKGNANEEDIQSSYRMYGIYMLDKKDKKNSLWTL